MINKHSSKNKKSFKYQKLSEDKEQKQIKHIINNLYKIKSIDRSQHYSPNTLCNIISEDKAGQFVIKELRKNKITAFILRSYGQNRLADIFEPVL